MIDRSIPQAPPASLDALTEKIEREIVRLKKWRPDLSDRVDRAANLLVTHLSCRRQRLIRVRVRRGRPRILVSGSRGAVYVVDPETWNCTCPDFHRRNAQCKHALAAYALARAARPTPKLPSCTSCEGRFPHAELIEVTHDDGSLTWFPGDLLCQTCIVTMGGIS